MRSPHYFETCSASICPLRAYTVNLCRVDISILKKRRQELNLSQAEVAKATGVSQPTYQNYEAGAKTIPVARRSRLARVLKLSESEVVGKPVRCRAARLPCRDAAGFSGL